MNTYTNTHLDLFLALPTTITTIVLLISALLRVEHTLRNRKEGKRNHYCRAAVRAPADAGRCWSARLGQKITHVQAHTVPVAAALGEINGASRLPASPLEESHETR